MSLGALVVLVVLVVAGIYIPRTATTKANDQAKGTQQKSNDSSAEPASSSSVPDADKTKARDSADANKTEPQESADQSAHDATQPSASKVDLTIPPGDSAAPKQVDQSQRISTADSARPKEKHALNVESKVAAAPGGGQQDRKVVPAAGGGQQVAGQDAGSARADAVQLEALEEQADHLSSRVSSINDSLDNLRNQQSANGYGLRGDIASAQELMKTHLAKAQAALQNQDVAGAKKYLDLAEGDAAKIDKFLGH
jgi:cytoskeletal protein RodZ